MFITSKCKCGKTLQVDEKARGKSAKCPACGNVFIVEDMPVNSPAAPTTVAQLPPPTPVSAGTPASAKRSLLPLFVLGGCGVFAVLSCVACGGAWMLVGTSGFFLMGAVADSKSDTARIQVKVLTNACQAYFIRHHQFPEQLRMLLEKDEHGGPYFDDEKALVDPWGKNYQYDQLGPRNQGKVPDIWTVNPRDETMIGNWSKTT